VYGEDARARGPRVGIVPEQECSGHGNRTGNAGIGSY
jgi:hypothetical protein